MSVSRHYLLIAVWKRDSTRLENQVHSPVVSARSVVPNTIFVRGVHSCHGVFSLLEFCGVRSTMPNFRFCRHLAALFAIQARQRRRRQTCLRSGTICTPRTKIVFGTTLLQMQPDCLLGSPKALSFSSRLPLAAIVPRNWHLPRRRRRHTKKVVSPHKIVLAQNFLRHKMYDIEHKQVRGACRSRFFSVLERRVDNGSKVAHHRKNYRERQQLKTKSGKQERARHAKPRAK